jgi:hypothetical protein
MIRGSFLARRANSTRLLLVTVMLTLLVTAALGAALSHPDAVRGRERRHPAADHRHRPRGPRGAGPDAAQRGRPRGPPRAAAGRAVRRRAAAGGYRRALAASPDLLIADEPTGQLDSETGRQIMRPLQIVVRSEGITPP